MTWLPFFVCLLVPYQAKAAELTAEQIFKKCSSSIVKIRVRDNNFRLIGEGSGFLVSSDGLIATNHHVIDQGDYATVTFANNSRYFVEAIVGSDKKWDLVLLKIEGNSFPFLELADSVPTIGTTVFAIGNPLGMTNTLSEGMVSGHRKIDGVDWIQVSTPISPGSSGGTLLDVNGKVVGVTSSSIMKGQNLNFAIPATRLSELLGLPREIRRLSSAGGKALDEEDAKYLDDVWALAKRGEWGDALRSLSKLQESYSTSASYWNALAMIQSALNNHDIALEAYQKSLHLNPSSASIRLNMVNSYISLQRYDDALQRCKQAINIDPSNSFAFHQLGRAYGCLEKIDLAISALKTSVKLESPYAATYNLLGIALKHKYELLRYEDKLKRIDESQWKEILEPFEIAISMDPTDFDSHIQAGTIYKSNLKNYEKAIEKFEAAVALKPTHVDTLIELAGAYQYLSWKRDLVKNGSKAIEIYEKVADLAPKHDSVYGLMGMTYQSMRLYKKALAAYQKDLQIAIVLNKPLPVVDMTKEEINEVKKFMHFDLRFVVPSDWEAIQNNSILHEIAKYRLPGNGARKTELVVLSKRLSNVLRDMNKPIDLAKRWATMFHIPLNSIENKSMRVKDFVTVHGIFPKMSLQATYLSVFVAGLSPFGR